MEPILETINLGNDENPRLIKIGSALNAKEKKDLQELLMEFQEVFAWSYKDMPGINSEITKHHVDTHDHMAKIESHGWLTLSPIASDIHKTVGLPHQLNVTVGYIFYTIW